MSNRNDAVANNRRPNDFGLEDPRDRPVGTNNDYNRRPVSPRDENDIDEGSPSPRQNNSPAAQAAKDDISNRDARNAEEEEKERQ